MKFLLIFSKRVLRKLINFNISLLLKALKIWILINSILRMDLLWLFVFICSFSASFILVQTKAAHGEEEEEDENDPYKTTDPKKREPSPCESNGIN